MIKATNYNMNRYIAIFIILALSLVSAKERIAIVQFTPSGVDSITAGNITVRFSYELSKTKRFEIVEREMMDKILEEQKFQSSGCVAQECAVEIGQMIGVSQIVSGSISKIENFYSLNIKLIDVATGQIIYQDMDDFEGSVKDFIQLTIKNMALKMAAEASKEAEKIGEATTQYSTTKKGEVIFNINKDNVAIFIDGRYSSRSLGKQVTLSISEGSHIVKFSLSGYNDWKKEINILADKQVSYDIELTSGMSTDVKASTGILLVDSNPPDATVFIDGIEKGTTMYQTTNIGIGEHEIRLEKNLYYPYIEITIIQADMIGEVRADLKANFGELSVNSVPTDAVIMIDGQVKGKTPYSIDQIKSGSYNIQVSKDLYHTHEENFIITDGSKNTRDIRLTPAFGKLAVITIPTGAEVRLDGQNRGSTPLELEELPSGNYHLMLVKDMYQTIHQDIVIEDGRTFKLNLKLEARSGLLSITGKPSGAEIAANGKKIGSIPLKDYRTAEGMLEMTVSAKDFHSQTEFLNIQRDQTYKQVFNLERHAGKLIVITEPPDAEVYLDKESRGKTPIILDGIQTGMHTLAVKHPEFLPQSEAFMLTLNQKKELRFKLMTYAGSIQQQIDNAKFKQRLSFGGAAVMTLIGLVMNAAAESNYDDYLNTTSYSDAADLYDKTVSNDKMASGCYIIAGAMAVPTVKFTLDIDKLARQLKGK